MFEQPSVIRVVAAGAQRPSRCIICYKLQPKCLPELRVGASRTRRYLRHINELTGCPGALDSIVNDALINIAAMVFWSRGS